MKPTCYIHEDDAGRYHIEHEGTVWSAWDDPAEALRSAYQLVRERCEGLEDAEARSVEDAQEIPGARHTGITLSSDGAVMGDIRISVDPNRGTFFVGRDDARIGPIDDEETAWYVAGAWYGSPGAGPAEIESLAEETVIRKD